MEEKTLSTDTSVEPTVPVEEKKLTTEDVECYMPIKPNMNYLGERIFKLGPLVYGAMARKRDNKLLITYNIDPEKIHPDFFVLVSESIVPKRVYELFKQKLFADIARLDNMMYNVVKNKSMLSTIVNYTEKNIDGGTDELVDIGEYTQEDSHKDKQIEAAKVANQQKLLSKSRQKKGMRKAKKGMRKAKAKIAKVSKKKNRKK